VQSVSCQAVWIESARSPDKCVLRRSASGGRTGSACATRHTPTLNALVGRSGRRLNLHRHTRQTKQSCLVVYGFAMGTGQLLITGSEFKFSVGDSLELSRIQFTPPRQTRHRQDCSVASGVAVWIGSNSPVSQYKTERSKQQTALHFFFLNIHYMDFPDCLLLFLSISVFYF